MKLPLPKGCAPLFGVSFRFLAPTTGWCRFAWKQRVAPRGLLRMFKSLMIVSVLMLSAVTACNAQIVALGASSTA